MLSTPVESLSQNLHRVALSTAFGSGRDVDNRGRKRSRYTRPSAGHPPARSLSSDETDLSAERTQAEAEAWFPQPHVDPCRPRDLETAPREGPQAPVGVSRCSAG